MKEIYLDNAATTSCDKQVLKVMEPYWSEKYGNPSSFNDAGREAKKAMEEARKKIARILGARSQEIIFTSSATEANNLAIFGTAEANKKFNRIITTRIEHHSVLEPVKKLEKDGFNAVYLPVDKEGVISLDELEKSIRPETILISVIYANNEIGSVQPIKKIGKIVKEFRKNSQFPYFHIDAAQTQSHLDLNVNNLGLDLMTLSSHKIHGPKGIAALYVRRGTNIGPLVYGGGQESGLRSSTEAVSLIVGFAKALEIANDKKSSVNRSQERLREYFINGLKKIFSDVKINGPENPRDRVPHIVNAVFKGIESEQTLLYLDKYGIRASAGSACSSYEIEPSHVLTAIGLSKDQARSSIRFSFSRLTAKTEIDYVLKVLPKIINKIQKIYPKEIKKQYFVKP